MTESDKNISQLLKSHLSKNESFIEKDEWKLTEIELYKKKFYKFSFSYFNIYYASVLVCTFLFTLTAGIIYFSRLNDFTTLSSKEKRLKKNDTSILETNDVVLQNEERPEKETPTRKNSQRPMKKQKGQGEKVIENLNPLSNHLPTIDSSNLMDDSKNKGASELLKTYTKKDSDNSVKKTVPKQETKVIYITKQDTIFKYDTLRVKKGKDKKIKK